MISAILLAAGTSSRMPSHNKLLLPFGETLLIRQIATTLLATKVTELIVVLGYQAEQVRAALEDLPGLLFVYNEAYQKGLTSSIQKGVQRAAAETEGLLICLGDMPLLTPKLIDQLIATFEQKLLEGAPICVPVFKDQHGHPVLFAAAYRAAILQHQAPNGCKAIIQQYHKQVHYIEVSTDSVLKDADTWLAYQTLLKSKKSD